LKHCRNNIFFNKKCSVSVFGKPNPPLLALNMAGNGPYPIANRVENQYHLYIHIIYYNNIYIDNMDRAS
jgi:hypothetical protein